jgi:hypothetical protein
MMTYRFWATPTSGLRMTFSFEQMAAAEERCGFMIGAARTCALGDSRRISLIAFKAEGGACDGSRNRIRCPCSLYCRG